MATGSHGASKGSAGPTEVRAIMWELTGAESVEQGGGWEFSCSRETAKQERRRERQKQCPKAKASLRTCTRLSNKDPRAHREQKTGCWAEQEDCEGDGRGEGRITPPKPLRPLRM